MGLSMLCPAPYTSCKLKCLWRTMFNIFSKTAMERTEEDSA